jgi:hypothetical protein
LALLTPGSLSSIADGTKAVEERIFSVAIASTTSLGLQSQLGYLDRPLFGKILLLSPNPSTHPAHLRRAGRDYPAHMHILD